MTLNDCQEYEEETFSEFLIRYKGFGKEIYLELKNQLPEIYQHLKFYKATKSSNKCVGNYPQTEDSYAVYSNGKNSFQIQLDPLCEVIIVWNYEISFETGYWSENEYLETINFIKENFTDNNACS